MKNAPAQCRSHSPVPWHDASNAIIASALSKSQRRPGPVAWLRPVPTPPDSTRARPAPAAPGSPAARCAAFESSQGTTVKTPDPFESFAPATPDSPAARCAAFESFEGTTVKTPDPFESFGSALRCLRELRRNNSEDSRPLRELRTKGSVRTKGLLPTPSRARPIAGRNPRVADPKQTGQDSPTRPTDRPANQQAFGACQIHRPARAVS